MSHPARVPTAPRPDLPSPALAIGVPELSDADFRRVAELTYRVAGIDLKRGKEGLVRARLARRLRALGMSDFPAYLARVESESSGGELREMIDALTTNKTSFFRESQHFDFIRERLLPAAEGRPGRPLRIWSAGCSSGEEPYSLAMLLRDELPARGADAARILATDISARVLARARAATYAPEMLAELPPDLLRRHFVPAAGGGHALSDPVRRMVSFARLNLMADWPMRGPFDAILCRNVMIYFDKPTQARLVARFHALLAPGGHLFVGHSESLTGLEHGFGYVQPAVYVKG